MTSNTATAGAGIVDDGPEICPIGLICKPIHLALLFENCEPLTSLIVNPKHIYSVRIISKIKKINYKEKDLVMKRGVMTDDLINKEFEINTKTLHIEFSSRSSNQMNSNIYINFIKIEDSTDGLFDPMYNSFVYSKHYEVLNQKYYYDDKDFTLMNSLIELICSKM